MAYTNLCRNFFNTKGTRGAVLCDSGNSLQSSAAAAVFTAIAAAAGVCFYSIHIK